MSSPAAPSTPAVPPSTPDASFAASAPPLPQLGKLDIVSPAAPAPPPKNVLRRSFSSHPAYKRAREAAEHAASEARRQVGKLRTHPAAVRTSDLCAKQAQSARELLGRSEAVVNAEQITGVDRLALVVSATLLFIVLVPANLLGLAAPVTTAIVALRPTYHAFNALTDGEEDVKHLLTFYVALGVFQTLEGCVPVSVLDAIPRYYMCKLILLTYLGHPRLKGSSKLYDRWKHPPVKAKQQAEQAEPSDGQVAKEAAQAPAATAPAGNGSLGQASPTWDDCGVYVTETQVMS